MVKKMIIFLSLLVILICVMCIFYARNIAKNRFERIEENKITGIIKIVGFIVIVGMLFLIYMYK